MVRPYYEHAGITIFHGDAREILPTLTWSVLVSDPPYGIAYKSEHFGTLPRSIQGDEDTSLRDWALTENGARPALIFGSWRRPRPQSTRMLLVWDTKGALGMGDLTLPWKPAHQEIYVIGSGFSGYRGTDVLSIAPVQSTAANGRVHPHEKPLPLMIELLGKCPAEWVIADPFAGSCSTLVAAKQLGRRAIGIELEERYCEIAAKRLSQEVLPFAEMTR